MKIRRFPAAIALAVALGTSLVVTAAPAAPAASAAPAKFKDVLLAYKGKDITLANSGKVDDARPRKLVLIGDDYFAVDLPDGRRNYFLYVRVASMQVADGNATLFLKD